MSDFDLTKYHISKTEKVSWRIPNDNRSPYALDHIKSSSQRKFLQNIDHILESNSITWHAAPIDRIQFLEWMEYYEAKMSEHDYRHIADANWFDTRISEGKVIEGMFFYKDGKLICSGIFVVEGTQKATFAFKASDRIDLSSKSNSSIGSVIDYFFLKEMLARNITIISAGKSRNAFGVHNTFGYLEYKLRFGYYPLIDDVDQETTVPLSEEGSVAFFAKQNNALKLFYVHPLAGAKELQALKVLPPSIESVEITY